MLDLKYLRHDAQNAAKKLARRGYHLDVTALEQLETQHKALNTKIQTLQHHANLLAKQLGYNKTLKPQSEGDLYQPYLEPIPISALMIESRQTKQQLIKLKAELQHLQSQLEAFLLAMPNSPHASVPIGQTAEANQTIRSWGEPKQFPFTPKDHLALGGVHIDFEGAVKITGSRFVILRGQLARLQRALIQFMLDIHTQEHGYEEVYVPYLVNAQSLRGTGQLPGFAEDLFTLKDADFYLIPTAEVPVTNLARDTLFNKNQLPHKYVCHTPCFRSEAGSYGKDVRGMIRQHQFEKVELVRFETAETAEQALEDLTHEAEVILQRLGLPYRVVALCSGDLGFASTKTYDLEVWLPGQSAFREISSCSHMGDFQARRLKARWRNPQTRQNEYIHTLNGSGLAVGRTLIALLENYQDAQACVQIPEALQPYMGGLHQISLANE